MILEQLLRAVACILLGVFFSADTFVLAQSKPQVSPREALLFALKTKLNSKSFRLKEVYSGSGEGVGISTTTVGEFVAPEKFHGMVETTGGGGQGELILLGRAGYVKTVDGKWQQKEVNTERMGLEFARFRNMDLIANLENAKDSDVKFLGEEKVDEASTLAYQYSAVSPTDKSATSQTKVWVSTADSLPRRIEVVTQLTQKGLKFIFKTTTTYYDYNADIVIEAPL